MSDDTKAVNLGIQFVDRHCQFGDKRRMVSDLQEIARAVREEVEAEAAKGDNPSDTELLDFAENFGCELNITLNLGNRRLRKQMLDLKNFYVRNSTEGA